MGVFLLRSSHTHGKPPTHARHPLEGIADGSETERLLGHPRLFLVWERPCGSHANGKHRNHLSAKNGGAWAKVTYTPIHGGDDRVRGLAVYHTKKRTHAITLLLFTQ